jgi:hypothetical protein
MFPLLASLWHRQLVGVQVTHCAPQFWLLLLLLFVVLLFFFFFGHQCQAREAARGDVDESEGDLRLSSFE